MYVVTAGGILSVLDAATGSKACEQSLNLGGTCYSSPVLAGNVIIFGSDSGKSVVITPGRDYKEIARAVLEPFRCTPLCDGAHMYIRTCNGQASKLYCIGN